MSDLWASAGERGASGSPRFDRLATGASILAALSSRDAPSLEDVARALCRAAAVAVGVDGVGVMLGDPRQLRVVHAEPGWVLDVERLQERYLRGPCWDCVSGQRVVAVQNVQAAQSWPELALRAAGGGGASDPVFHAVASVPLTAPGRSFGVLDLYRHAQGPWGDADLTAASVCVQLAAALLGVVSDRDHWQRACAEAQRRSGHDELTGLPGRGLYFDRLDHALATASRHGGSVAVLFIDVDGFKRINDTHGHAVGDAALAEVAHRLRLNLRVDDTLARLSGDEFVIVCEALHGTGEQVHGWLHRLGERILRELQRPAAADETTIDVSVSIGAAVATGRSDARQLTRQADHAMYAAKNTGGGRLVISTAAAIAF